MSSEPLLSSQFCPELQRWLESVTALSCQLIGSAPGANRQLWTSKRLKLLLEHELLIAQPLSPQTQASHGASHPPVLPSPPPLNLLSCLSAPLLLLPPFPLQFFKHEGGGGFSPLLSAPPFFSSPGNTLNHSYNPPKPTPPPPHCYLNLHSNECAIPRPPPTHPFSSAMGDCPGAEEGVKRRAAHVHTQFQAQKHSTPPHSHPSIVYMCVYVCAHLQRNTGTWWVTDERGGELGGVLMALSAGNGLLLHRQLQSQQSSQASSPHFICIGKTHVHSQLGRVSPSHRLMTMQNCSCRAKKYNCSRHEGKL